jgi:hypothetical protein
MNHKSHLLHLFLFVIVLLQSYYDSGFDPNYRACSAILVEEDFRYIVHTCTCDSDKNLSFHVC